MDKITKTLSTVDISISKKINDPIMNIHNIKSKVIDEIDKEVDIQGLQWVGDRFFNMIESYKLGMDLHGISKKVYTAFRRMSNATNLDLVGILKEFGYNTLSCRFFKSYDDYREEFLETLYLRLNSRENGCNLIINASSITLSYIINEFIKIFVQEGGDRIDFLKELVSSSSVDLSSIPSYYDECIEEVVPWSNLYDPFDDGSTVHDIAEGLERIFQLHSLDGPYNFYNKVNSFYESAISYGHGSIKPQEMVDIIEVAFNLNRWDEPWIIDRKKFMLNGNLKGENIDDLYGIVTEFSNELAYPIANIFKDEEDSFVIKIKSIGDGEDV